MNHFEPSAAGRSGEHLLRDIVQAIVLESAPERIILFGSRAKGTAGTESDVDLLIIETEPFGPGRSRRKEMVRFWKVLAKFPIAKDILVYSREEVERWQTAKNHVLAHALREGKVLYERT